MLANKKIACVIPARLASSRFPKKILAELGGKPLIWHVWQAAKKVRCFDQVCFAIDAEETARVIDSFGGRYFMTDVNCPNGTARLIQLQSEKKIQADIFVNWQADEPFVNEAIILELLSSCHRDDVDLWSLRKKIDKEEEALSPHVAKVVADVNGFALYFSRSIIPYYRTPRPFGQKLYFKHVGLYAYTSKALRKIATLSPTYLEEAEQLEQLQFLAHGLKILLHETEHETLGIDLPEHLAAAQNKFKLR